jgi:hypothetical protein
VCRGRSNACNPLAPRIDKNLGNPVVKKVWVDTLVDRRGIRLLSVNNQSDRCTTPVRLVQVRTDREMVFVVMRMLGLVQVVEVLVVGMGSL